MIIAPYCNRVVVSTNVRLQRNKLVYFNRKSLESMVEANQKVL